MIKLRSSKLCYLLTAVCLTATAANAQFKLPKVKIPGKSPIAIPGVDKLLKDEPIISTSLADTAPQVPYLDDYDPKAFAPMVEVPRSLEGDFLRFPGLYQYVAESYCLHAGSYAPRSGNGYLYAPLQGKGADVINKILSNSVFHPEVEQRNIQLLIWGILAKTKISNMRPEIQETAKTLLSKKDIDKLNGGALGKIPDDVRRQVMAKLPPMARMAFEAETNLRNMLSSQTRAAYSDIERVAVFEGDPPDTGQYVPNGRWSYHPNGFFMRMFPSGYSTTRVQIYDPEPIDVERDEQGRIQRVTNPRGDFIETEYSDAAPLSVAGEDGLRGWAFRSVRFVSASDPAQPGARREAEWKDSGWTLAGALSGKGKPADSPAPFADAAARYTAAQEYSAQTEEMAKEFGKQKYSLGAANSPARILLNDLAFYRAALKSLIEAQPQQEWTKAHADIVANAWQSALYSAIAGTRSTSAQSTPAPSFQRVDYRFARKLQSFDEGSYRNGGGGGGAGGGAGMPRPGRQRLAQSNRPKHRRNPDNSDNPERKSGGGSGPDSIDKARQLTGRMSDANDLVTLATGGPAGYAGGYLPGKMFGEILDFILDTGRKITDALDMDPPRDDFHLYAQPEKISIAPIEAGEGLSPERAAAWNAVMDGSLDVLAKLRAAHLSVDRHGGALQAKDRLWVYRQGGAIVHYKKEIGVAMIALAGDVEKLVEISKKENIADPRAKSEQMSAYQQRLRTEGFSAQELEAARLIGLSDEEIAQIKTERLAADPQRVQGKTMTATLSEMAQSLRLLGAHLNALPPVELNGFTPDETKQQLAALH